MNKIDGFFDTYNKGGETHQISNLLLNVLVQRRGNPPAI